MKNTYPREEHPEKPGTLPGILDWVESNLIGHINEIPLPSVLRRAVKELGSDWLERAADPIMFTDAKAMYDLIHDLDCVLRQLPYYAQRALWTDLQDGPYGHAVQVEEASNGSH